MVFCLCLITWCALTIPQISLKNNKILQSLNLNIIESNIKITLAYYATSYLALHPVVLTISLHYIISVNNIIIIS
jgi:hypothetical protein